ncbi:MAG: sensor histidine kinase, partial [Verrucomicrobiota bacterium]
SGVAGTSAKSVLRTSLVNVFRVDSSSFQRGPPAIARHSEAQSVVVRLRSDGARITLSIEDDGRGLPAGISEAAKSPTLGMTGMRARARQCGGDIEISRGDPQGLRLVVTVPVRPPSPEPA